MASNMSTTNFDHSPQYEAFFRLVKQGNDLVTLILAIAAFSIPLAMFTLYCFLRMKRSFHHYLILLLIISDMIKQLWYFICAVIVFVTNTPVKSGDTFCSISGYLIIEAQGACDVAILFIALHNGLYVLRPPKRSQKGGLYHYRWLCFALWIILPLLPPSLAFIHRGQAFTTVGAFCFIPQSPIWYRLALVWIPRVIIITLSLGIYLSIYIFVLIKFRAIKAMHEASRLGQGSGSFGTTVQDSRSDWRSPESTLLSRSRCQSEGGTINTTVSPDSPDFKTSMDTPEAKLASSSRPNIQHRLKNLAIKVAHNIFHPRSTVPKASQRCTHERPNPVNTSSSQIHEHENETDPNLARARIQKQLGYLCFYPISYLLLWIPAFVVYCIQFRQPFYDNFALDIVVICTLNLQCALDCLFFSWRERPWNLIEGPEKRFIERIRRSLRRRRPSQHDTERRDVRPHGERPAYWWDEERRPRDPL